VRTGTSACRGVILPGRRFPARRLAHATYRHKYFSPRRVSKPRNLPSPPATANRTERLAPSRLLASPERTCKQVSRRISAEDAVAESLDGGAGGGGERGVAITRVYTRPARRLPTRARHYLSRPPRALGRHNFVPARPLAVGIAILPARYHFIIPARRE